MPAKGNGQDENDDRNVRFYAFLLRTIVCSWRLGRLDRKNEEVTDQYLKLPEVELRHMMNSSVFESRVLPPQSTRCARKSYAVSLVRTFFFTVLFAALAMSAQANSYIETGSVVGVVQDENGASLTGASVQLYPVGSGIARYSTISDESGRFVFNSVQAGRYDLFVSYVGFVGSSTVVQVREGARSEIDIELNSAVIAHSEVVVSAGRARERLSPVTVKNITAQEMEEQPDMKDLPVHLARQPSITYHSENGNAIGYSTLRMRGFDQRRLAVAINGIPQNDPEEFNVFWINFFDIQGAVQDIQIQRGAGASVYGPTAIGGAINLRAMPYRSEFDASVQIGGGAFGTRRYSAEVNSGLLDDRYVVFTRFSRLESDGYRDWSWTEFWRFFAGITRFGERSTLTIQAYGGPQKDGLAYSGIPKAANEKKIDDGFGGTIDRTYNFSAFDQDIENFHQPHVEIHHEYDINESLRFSQTAFLIKGEGYFDFGGTFRSADYLNLPDNFVPPAQRSQPLFISSPETALLFRAYLDQWQMGWMPRVTVTREGSTTSIGSEFRLHRSLRWGRIQEATGVPSSVVGSENDVRVYSFRGEKAIISAYASHLQRFSDLWAFQGDVQITHRKYRSYDDSFFGVSFSKPYFFVNPRVGVTFRPESSLSAFASIALAHREPRMKTLYDGEEVGGGFLPQFERNADDSFDYDNPLVDPERLVDLELGASKRGSGYGVTANVFVMDFRDEIVPSGGLDQFGVPRTGNAERTRHIGLEVDGSVLIASDLTLSGNFTISRNRFVEFDEFVTPPDFRVTQLDRSGNVIAGFPERSGNVQATYRRGGLTASMMASFVGKQYIDNGQGIDASGSEVEDLSLEAFHLIDGSVSYVVGKGNRLRLAMDVNNVLNEKVLTYGNVSVVGPQFFPAATRHLFLSARYTIR